MIPLVEDSPYEIAAGMAQDIAVNVLSSEASNLVDPVFAALGIGGSSSDDAAYFSQIETALTAIEGTLTQVAAKLATLSTGIAQIENQLTAISSQIEDAELQSQLAQYTENANIIEQNYQSFSAAIAAMGNVATFEQGTNALFSLLQTDNANAVATAMRNVHDLLVGSGELRGIVSYQILEANRIYTAMAANPSLNTRLAWTGAPYDGSWIDAFQDGEMIIEMIPAMLSAAFAQPIIPALTAAMALQAKGLSFLCAAWGGTIDASNLQTHTDNVRDIVSAMRGLFALFDFDTMASAVIQTTGPSVAELASQTWALQGGASAGPPPFDGTWVFWSVAVTPSPSIPVSDVNPLFICGVAQQPWNYGTVTWYNVGNYGMGGIEMPDGSFTFCTYICNSNSPPTSVSIAAPSSRNFTAPANLTAFLATLPAASSAMEASRAPSQHDLIHQRAAQ